jgi:hypothetical protein
MSGGRQGKADEKRRKEYYQGARGSREAPLYFAGRGSTSAKSQVREI